VRPALGQSHCAVLYFVLAGVALPCVVDRLVDCRPRMRFGGHRGDRVAWGERACSVPKAIEMKRNHFVSEVNFWV
jgi:hypothetical protein